MTSRNDHTGDLIKTKASEIYRTRYDDIDWHVKETWAETAARLKKMQEEKKDAEQ